MSTTDTANDFLKGQNDCADGVPHKEEMPIAYERGWGAEQIAKQIRIARRIRHGK